MKFEEASRLLEGIPHISRERAKQLYDFILAADAREVLELGFAHGVSTCYMAAALDERGEGHVITVDTVLARDRDPNLDSLLRRSGLGRYVEPVYGEQSYTWELKKMIERQTVNGVCAPLFDFCFIDGAHTWETDGFAFFLVDKLLRSGGWLLFDDLDWRLADSPVEMEKPWIRSLPDDMKTTPHIAKVFELLVCQHLGYGDFRVDGRWGWARKHTGSSNGTSGAADVLDRIYGSPTITHDAYVLARRLAGRLLGRN